MKLQFKKHAVAVALSLLCSTVAVAASKPEGSSFDQRIKTVLYNPDDVTLVMTRPGNTTLIQLEPGEYLVKLPTGGLSIGDSGAWTIGVRGNNIFLKPKDSFPETNINLVTNRRTYALELMETKDKALAAWQVRYRYPAIPKPVKEAVVDNGPCSDGPINRNYFKYGNQDLSPTEVWDDGRFTCMRFPTSKPLPNIYRYMPNSELKEGMPATHMKDDVLVIHETSQEFRLRIGNSVLGIKTDSLRPAPYNWKRTTTGETRVILNAK